MIEESGFPSSGNAFVFVLRFASNLGPVLFPHILVDLDGPRSGPMPILPVLLAAGDPVLIACFDIEVVSADTRSLEGFEPSTGVLHRTTGLREPNAANAGRASIATLALEFDVHDPRLQPLPFRTTNRESMLTERAIRRAIGRNRSRLGWSTTDSEHRSGLRGGSPALSRDRDDRSRVPARLARDPDRVGLIGVDPMRFRGFARRACV